MAEHSRRPGSGGERAEEVLARYGEHVNSSMARLYRFMGLTSIEWEGEGAVLRDTEGNEFLDFSGYGVFFHGHRHPRVVAAVREQLDRLPLSSRILPNATAAALAEALARWTPGDLQYAFFCNSGTEAVEAALKLARARTGRSKLVATRGAFHGKTLGSLSVSGRELFRTPFQPLLPEVEHVPYGDAEALAHALDDRTAAFVVEPIQGEGGVILPPPGYLAAARRLCDRTGALLIADEVQTGVGRTGRFLACEWEGVVPDVVALAKSLGGGVMPIGAIVARPDAWRPFDENPFLHSSTFGGNPLACAAALAGLAAIAEEGLLERAERLGEQALAALRRLAAELPRTIADVRGRGLLIGIELTKEGAGGMLIAETFSRHLLVIHSLNNPKVIRVMPPAVIGEEQLDRALGRLAEALRAVDAVIDEL